MIMDFDPTRLRLRSPIDDVAVRRPKDLPRHRKGERFLKGPIPLAWLMAAGSQPGKALHVAVALWFLAGVNRNRAIALSTSLLSSFGVGRYAGYRALRALEHAGLVSVVRHPGRLPIVTILDGPATYSMADEARTDGEINVQE